MPGFLYQWPLWLAGALMTVVLVGFATASLFVVRRLAFRTLRFGSHFGEFGGAMLHSMMVFYGLVTALIAVNVYETHTDVDRVVSREATSLAALYRDVSGYPEPGRTQLRAAIASYTRYVIDEAWPQQRRGEVPRGGVDEVNVIQDRLMAFEPVTEGQKLLHGEVLRAYNEVVLARRLRLDGAGAHLPGLMWAMLWMGAGLCLLGGCFFNVEDVRLHGLGLGLVAWLMSIVLFVTLAWDRPFTGRSGVGPEAYQLVYDQLMSH